MAGRSDQGIGLQAIRFILVGGLNTAFGYTTYAIGYLAGLPPTGALLFSACIGVFFNFFTVGTLVFGTTRPAAFPKLAVNAALVFLLNGAVLNAVIHAGVSPLPAEIIALCVVMPINFVVAKYLIFRSSTPEACATVAEKITASGSGK